MSKKIGKELQKKIQEQLENMKFDVREVKTTKYAWAVANMHREFLTYEDEKGGNHILLFQDEEKANKFVENEGGGLLPQRISLRPFAKWRPYSENYKWTGWTNIEDCKKWIRLE